MIPLDLENLRRSYEESSLSDQDLLENPIQQFEVWFAEAQSAPSADWFEANAMTLATADASGSVSARIVLLKQVSEEGFVFFTNYESDKGKQLAENPQASLVLYWPHVERQVRIEGTVSKTDAETSDRYFHARPVGSQCGAVASAQSRPLADRQLLVDESLKLAEQYGDAEIPRPDYWGGFVLAPSRVEFWQGRPSRLHDRFLYSQLEDESWKIERLAP